MKTAGDREKSQSKNLLVIDYAIQADRRAR